MASSDELVLLQSTLEIAGKPYSVKLTSSEIYWDAISSKGTVGGPYSEPLVKYINAEKQEGVYFTNTPQIEIFPSIHTHISHPNFVRVKPVVESSRLTLNDCTLNPADLYSFQTHNGPPVVSRPKFGLPNKSNNNQICHLCNNRKTENQTAKISEIIAVCQEKETPNISRGTPIATVSGDGLSTTDQGKFQQLEMVALNNTSFSIYVVQRYSKHRWKPRKIVFNSTDSSIVSQWVDKIQEFLSKPAYSRPKNLLVFVNPFGGKGKAEKIYSEKVAPLFDKAGINIDLVSTKRANHARDTLYDYDLSKIDGVVAVGGDGMFSEVMHGLLYRAMQDHGMDKLLPGVEPPKPDLRIGIIPAGSTDTIIFSAAGNNDPVTAALHIILGDEINIDLSTVHQGTTFLRYNISMLAYGFFGDCLITSEQDRWMGPLRYNWAGVKRWAKNKCYEGEVMYLPSLDRESNPRDGTRCRSGCQVCQTADTNRPSVDANQSENWESVKGRFMAINAFTISCKCAMTVEGPAPCCHLGDGYLDLVLVQECSRGGYLRYLTKTVSKKSDQFDLPHVKVVRVKEFKFRQATEDMEDTHEAQQDGSQRLRSRPQHQSIWNCDGEFLKDVNVDVRVHRQVIRMFARGVEEYTSESTSCTCCAGKY